MKIASVFSTNVPWELPVSPGARRLEVPVIFVLLKLCSQRVGGLRWIPYTNISFLKGTPSLGGGRGRGEMKLLSPRNVFQRSHNRVKKRPDGCFKKSSSSNTNSSTLVIYWATTRIEHLSSMPDWLFLRMPKCYPKLNRARRRVIPGFDGECSVLLRVGDSTFQGFRAGDRDVTVQISALDSPTGCGSWAALRKAALASYLSRPPAMPLT